MKIPEMSGRVRLLLVEISEESKSAQDFLVRLKQGFPKSVVVAEKIFDKDGQLVCMYAEVVTTEGVTYGVTYEPGAGILAGRNADGIDRKLLALKRKSRK